MAKDFIHCPYCGVKLNALNNEGRPLCSICGFTHWDPPVPVAVAVIPVKLVREFGIVGVQRVKDPEDGWCMPGGFVQKDEDPIDAALREAREETGLTKLIANQSLWRAKVPNKNQLVEFILCHEVNFEDIKDKLKAGDDAKQVTIFKQKDRPTSCFTTHEQTIFRILRELNKN